MVRALLVIDVQRENSAGVATAEQLQQSTLVAQQMFISEVISSDKWRSRINHP